MWLPWDLLELGVSVSSIERSSLRGPPGGDDQNGKCARSCVKCGRRERLAAFALEKRQLPGKRGGEEL